MNCTLQYREFLQSSFGQYLKENGITTGELLNFIASLVDVRNFAKNHILPIVRFYWEKATGNDEEIENLAITYNIHLNPKVSYIEDLDGLHRFMVKFPKNQEVAQDTPEFEKKYPSFIAYDNKLKPSGKLSYKLSDINNLNLDKNQFIEYLSSQDIINNEILWEKDMRIDFHSIRHSSDDFEYIATYNTGWYYLSLNKHIILDCHIISYFKNKIIALKRESHNEYMAYGAWQPVNKVSINALMAFRDKNIDESLISSIINDPLSWEGGYL